MNKTIIGKVRVSFDVTPIMLKDLDEAIKFKQLRIYKNDGIFENCASRSLTIRRLITRFIKDNS